MITFFKKGSCTIYAVESCKPLSASDQERLVWLFSGAFPLKSSTVKGLYVGPRKEMITPWSTNAVEMAANMGVSGITRIERFERSLLPEPAYDQIGRASCRERV